ncbi:MAG: polyprenyl synthetase family protein [Propionibacteriaceae bacterium]|nr:polyprenyl synthetase family protein [Propionibacteriaceae bacterium]
MLRDLSADSPLSNAFLERVDADISRFFDGQTHLMDAVGTSQLLAQARTYSTGGKRLRPAFCLWAYLAVGGDEAFLDEVLRVAASLDLLHASALAHDDILDDADTRRGKPAAHKQYALLHAERHGRGSAQAFGEAAAILLGDMLLMWSAQMFDESAAPNLEAARADLSRMRAEVTAGQFLDISAAYDVADDADELAVASKVLEYKSASYSMRRPALIGARLGGATDAQYAALASFGSHIGHAFQLRDDVLGVWGDEALTGKPTGGDLREGKATVLVLTALREATDEQAATLRAVLGSKECSDDAVQQAAQAIEATGARAHVERLIDEHLEQGLEALASAAFDETGRAALIQLAKLSTRRAY